VDTGRRKGGREEGEKAKPIGMKGRLKETDRLSHNF
jgi:hypothetical protein